LISLTRYVLVVKGAGRLWISLPTRRRYPVAEEMPEKARQLFLIFRKAVQREREAQNTYKHAAELCEDKELKGLLVGFYRDEVRHESALVERYNSLCERYGVQAE
jgi:rubrerythrin